jgi:4-amino-4-deoxy-L-arabinose transferase-like glycosyltransferase
MSAPSPALPRPERLAALRAPAAGVAALTALAAVLRFATLGDQSYWLDEAVTVALVSLPFDDMLSAIPDSESTPPLYYVIAWVWKQVFGAGEVGLRSLSALAGVVTVPVAYSAAARLVNARVGLIVAGLAAVNPLLVWFSQEARTYSLLVLLTTAAFAVYARLLERRTGRALAAWALLSALAFAAHYFAIFVIAPQLAWLLWRSWQERERSGVLMAGAAVGVAIAALMPLMIEQASNDRAGFIRAIELPKRVAQIPKQYLVGFDAPLEAFASVLALALAGFGLWLLWKRADAGERRGAFRAATVAVPALLIPVAMAVVSFDYVVTRNLLPAWVPAVTIVAVGFGARRAGRAGPAAAVALGAVSLAVVVAVAASPEYQRGDWRGAARALGPVPDRARALVITPAYGVIPLNIYSPGTTVLPPGPVDVAEIDVIAVAERSAGQTPKPPRPAELPPPPPGFDPPEVRRTDTYTLVRYRATNGAWGITAPMLQQLRLTAAGADIAFQTPPG